MHVLEYVLLAASGVATLVALWLALRKRAAETSFLFLLAQFFSWILGLVAVQFAWLDYPVHEFAKANSSSFLFEYFILPTLCVYFVLRYPTQKRLVLRLAYFAVIVSAFTIFEVVIERFTDILEYHEWKWYWTWLSMSFVYYLCFVIYKWFFGHKRVFSL